MHLRTCHFSSGERFPVLLTLNWIPVPLPTRYTVHKLRDSDQLETIVGKLRAIRFLYQWSAEYTPRIDLEERIRSGEFLTTAHLLSFKEWVRSRKNMNVVQMRTEVLPGDKVAVSNNTVNTYIDAVRDFLVWAHETQGGAGEPELNRHATKWNANKLTATPARALFALTPEQQRRLLQHVHPCSPTNPFHEPIRLRNYLIVCVLLYCGVRRGELLKIRVGDAQTKGGDTGYITVVRRPDDPADPRSHPPSVKTRGRRLYISDELRGLLVAYLRQRKSKQPYLFVDPETGFPLSGGAITVMIDRIRTTDPMLLETGMTAHSLRRSFEENLTPVLEKSGFPPEVQTSIRNYLSGWSEQSQQAAVYMRHQTETQAAELLQQTQKALDAYVAP
jgi:integrase